MIHPAKHEQFVVQVDVEQRKLVMHVELFGSAAAMERRRWIVQAVVDMAPWVSGSCPRVSRMMSDAPSSTSARTVLCSLPAAMKRLPIQARVIDATRASFSTGTPAERRRGTQVVLDGISDSSRSPITSACWPVGAGRVAAQIDQSDAVDEVAGLQDLFARTTDTLAAPMQRRAARPTPGRSSPAALRRSSTDRRRPVPRHAAVGDLSMRLMTSTITPSSTISRHLGEPGGDDGNFQTF